MNELLKEAAEELAILHLHNGVQPSDLADAMYENPYLEFKITKAFEQLIVDLCFLDECDGKNTTIRMKYFYNLDKQLQRIDQKIGLKKFSTQWCRIQSTNEAIAKVERTLSMLEIDSVQIKAIMSTLPPNVRSLLRAKLALAA
jgi:choline kinase